jgi:hypothetical protein
MAYGAYLAAQDAGRDKDIKFIIGIDGLPDEALPGSTKVSSPRHSSMLRQVQRACDRR